MIIIRNLAPFIMHKHLLFNSLLHLFICYLFAYTSTVYAENEQNLLLTNATSTVVNAAESNNLVQTQADQQALQDTSKAIEQLTAIEKKPLINPNQALVKLAMKYGKSTAGSMDYAEVYDQYCTSARDGDQNAQYALGWMHEMGKGAPQDQKIAKQFYTIAAEQGNALASEALTHLTDTIAGLLPPCMLPKPVEFDEPLIVLSEETQAEIDAIRASAEPAISEKTERLFKSQRSVYNIVNKLAKKYSIDPNLVMTFIAIESAFDVNATSPMNAQGLMQLIPKTAKRFGVKNPYRAEDNIKGGIQYLHWLLAYYEGHIELVAAAYNAGEKAVDRYKGVPPYSETQHYVKKIAKLYKKRSHPFKENIVSSSPILDHLSQQF